MSVTLACSGITVTLQNPDRNDLLAIRKQQAMQDRADGKATRYELAAGDRIDREYAWSEMRRDERDALAAFFQTTVDGILTDFTFTDERGASWNAHFLNTDLEFRTVSDSVSSSGSFAVGAATYPTTTRSGGTYSVTIRLRLWTTS